MQNSVFSTVDQNPHLACEHSCSFRPLDQNRTRLSSNFFTSPRKKIVEARHLHRCSGYLSHLLAQVNAGRLSFVSVLSPRPAGLSKLSSAYESMLACYGYREACLLHCTTRRVSPMIRPSEPCFLHLALPDLCTRSPINALLRTRAAFLGPAADVLHVFCIHVVGTIGRALTHALGRS